MTAEQEKQAELLNPENVKRLMQAAKQLSYQLATITFYRGRATLDMQGLQKALDDLEMLTRDYPDLLKEVTELIENDPDQQRVIPRSTIGRHR